MKKAFDQNVSRARPRLRVGALTEAADQAAAALTESREEPAVVEPEQEQESRAEATLQDQVKARAERSRAPKASAAETMQRALESAPRQPARAEEIVAQATSMVLGTRVPPEAVKVTQTQARHVQADARAVQAEAPLFHSEPQNFQAEPVEAARAPVMRAEPPAHVTEVQTPEPEHPMHDYSEADAQARRDRLKERLRAVRENPRPEPLPPSVAEAGVLAVERISSLQTELNKLRAMNLALTQDLEGARRQAEKATEEARLRMDESRRLSQEMEGRVKLLQELERELASLEGERDDALLSLQEARQALDSTGREKDELRAEIEKRETALSESLLEEERLCSELELAREDASALRRSVDALQGERDTLARQVAELTAERAELLEARKALEAVHRALSQAASR